MLMPGQNLTKAERHGSQDNCSGTGSCSFIFQWFISVAWLPAKILTSWYPTRKYTLEDPQAEISGPSQSPRWEVKEERADPQPSPRLWTICLRRPGQMNVLKFYTNIHPKAFPGVCSGFNIYIACLSQACFNLSQKRVHRVHDDFNKCPLENHWSY